MRTTKEIGQGHINLFYIIKLEEIYRGCQMMPDSKYYNSSKFPSFITDVKFNVR